MSWQKTPLTVEVHGVSPAHTAWVVALTDALADIGIRTPSLLVIPSHIDYQGRFWDLRGHSALVHWLQAQYGAGAEILLGGMTHQEEEFANLSVGDAASRIEAGVRMLRQCGLQPSGFASRDYHHSEGTVAALRQLEFPFLLESDRVILLDDRPEVPTQTVSFSSTNSLMSFAKRTLGSLADPNVPLRVALHASQAGVPKYIPAVVRNIEILAKRRWVTGFGTWLRAKSSRRPVTISQVNLARPVITT